MEPTHHDGDSSTGTPRSRNSSNPPTSPVAPILAVLAVTGPG